MGFFKILHDYVKDNYENGIYRENEKWFEKDKNSVDDYQLGYEQAKRDYHKHHTFKRFPSTAANFINIVANNKAVEVSKFISGYENANTIFSQRRRFNFWIQVFSDSSLN
ncbi:hypothetical protein [Leuconostoc sp. MTCC 10508]|uniref:hypothetical protein n=1 Tax=Leuconostoc sp. MTCC 10508 TaxID=2698683 RepID=UPI0020BFA115|nr:hypothetical protein [Leuconostoc sp. MTCC 10508]